MKTLKDNICEALVKGNANKIEDEPAKLIEPVDSCGFICNYYKWPKDIRDMIEDIASNDAKDYNEILEKKHPYCDNITKYYNMLHAVCVPRIVMEYYTDIPKSGKEHKISIITKAIYWYFKLKSYR